ncbi:hypothetical protein TB2_021903 [Malus domestica]
MRLASREGKCREERETFSAPRRRQLPKVQTAAPGSSLPSKSTIREPRDCSVHPRLGRQRKGNSKLVTFGDREPTAVLSLPLLDSRSTHTAALPSSHNTATTAEVRRKPKRR